MTTRTYTPAQVLANLRIIAENLAQPPAPSERAWMRWVLADIEQRGIATPEPEESHP